MAAPHRRYEIRCPVHGFIDINDWEREIINHPAFQRLRRIRQLAWTDQIYPGAMHTRFEHSLGVMHLATRLYEAVWQRSGDLLGQLGYDKQGFERHRTLVRLTALLHDVGHSPFSHAGEEVFPVRTDGSKRYKHEAYSAAIIRHELKSIIEDHPLNRNVGFSAEDIIALLEGSSAARHQLFWRDLIDGQLDADRMDYLLRDSLHAGVDYGRYDWRRLLNTVQVVMVTEGEGDTQRQSPRLGVAEGGVHAAEGLVLARYFMFTQVYFHRTRVAYDHHLRHALGELLPNGQFPPPTPAGLKEYLNWDDWRVLGMLADRKGGEHGRRLAERNHYREVHHTPESPREEDFTELARIKEELGEMVRAEAFAEKSWYKVDRTDIPIVSETEGRRIRLLSDHSPIVANLKPTNRVMLFARPEEAEAARAKVRKLTKERP